MLERTIEEMNFKKKYNNTIIITIIIIEMIKRGGERKSKRKRKIPRPLVKKNIVDFLVVIIYVCYARRARVSSD